MLPQSRPSFAAFFVGAAHENHSWPSFIRRRAKGFHWTLFLFSEKGVDGYRLFKLVGAHVKTRDCENKDQFAFTWGGCTMRNWKARMKRKEMYRGRVYLGDCRCPCAFRADQS